MVHMSSKTFYLVHQQARENCAQFAMTAPDGWRVRFSEPARSLQQNDRMHAMIADIAKQVRFLDRDWHEDDMKRLLVDDFAEEMRMAGTPLHHDGRVFPSFDGRRIVQLGIQTRDFYKKEAAQFIEYLYAYGAHHNVVWTEASKVAA